MFLVHNDLDLGVDEFNVPLVSVCGGNAALTSVFRKFMSSSKVGHRLVAWPCRPYSIGV